MTRGSEGRFKFAFRARADEIPTSLATDPGKLLSNSNVRAALEAQSPRIAFKSRASGYPGSPNTLPVTKRPEEAPADTVGLIPSPTSPANTPHCQAPIATPSPVIIKATLIIISSLTDHLFLFFRVAYFPYKTLGKFPVLSPVCRRKL